MCDGAELRLWAEEAAFELLAKVEGGWFVVEEAEGDGGPMNTDGGLRVWRLAIIILLCYLRSYLELVVGRRDIETWKGPRLAYALAGPEVHSRMQEPRTNLGHFPNTCLHCKPCACYLCLSFLLIAIDTRSVFADLLPNPESLAGHYDAHTYFAGTVPQPP